MSDIVKSGARAAASQEQKPLAAPMPAKHSFKPLKDCKTLEEAFGTHEFLERIQASVPQHIQPQRMLRTFVSAVSNTPLLAQVSLRSFLGVCLTASQVGLEPNTPLGHLWLIPIKTKLWNPKTKRRDIDSVEVTQIFGYPGLLDLSYRTTKVKSVHADVVWPGDDFSFEYGTDAHLRHKPRGHKPGEQPVWAYMHAGLEGGQAFEVMPYSDVLAIRDKAQAYRYALSAKTDAEAEGKRLPKAWTEAPWVAHEIPMSRKTAFRAGSKWLPRSVELASVIALDEAADRKRAMNFGAVMDAPTIDGTPDYLGAAVNSALSEDEPEPHSSGVDPLATFSRRPPPTIEHEHEREPQPPKVQPNTTVYDTTQAPAFLAVVINAFGEPLPDEYLSAKSFAQALAAQSREYDNENTIETLIEYNADAIEAARMDPEAAAILDAMMGGDAGAVEPLVGPDSGVVEPVADRGKPYWIGYPKQLQAAMAAVPVSRLDGWLNAQRPTLQSCPIGQRVLAIRAIAEAAGTLGITPPAWLGEMMRPPAAPSGAAPSGDGADERWITTTLASIPTLDRPEFDALVKSTAVQTVMARLKRDRPDLFARAAQAFDARHGELPAAPSQG